MHKLKPLALIGLVSGPQLLFSHVKTSFALERPVHSATIVLAFVGTFFVLCARFLPHYFDSDPTPQSYSSVPLEDVGNTLDSPPPSPGAPPQVLLETPDNPPTVRRLRLAFIVLVIALCLRVALIYRVTKNIECSTHSYNALLPLLFAALDYWTIQRHRTLHQATEQIDDSVYDLAGQTWAGNSLRYLIPTAILTLASALLLRTEQWPGSTYICPAATLARHEVNVSRYLTLPVDFCILFSLSLILQPSPSSSLRRSLFGRPFYAVGYATLVSAFVTFIIGLVYFFFSPDDRTWMLSIPRGYNSSLFKLVTLSCFTAISICLSIQFYAVTIPTAIVLFTMTTQTSIISSWNQMYPFPPVSESLAYFLYLCVLLGFVSLLVTQSISEQNSRRSRALFSQTPGWLYGFLFVLFMFRTTLWLSHASHASFHPADMLVFGAKIRHEKYTAWASSSTDLAGAVRTYKARYKRHPPPGFDRWYEYATTRKAKIIDDFDRVHDDLLPYWAVSPADLRQRTWQAISNPWNDVAGISVRNGSAQISPNVMPTHRWMLDGVIEMINHFAQWLPDMDLGFNLNDESRISVPYNDIERLNKIGKGADVSTAGLSSIFSQDRAATWAGIPEESIHETPFRELSWQRTFYEFGNSACPPGSPARNGRYWDTAHLCTSCAAPHSLGAFLSDWTKSADICHQPDMANLHGFYLSPAAFKASHDLIPVFSQSKAPGYNDILYPSAWNYMDKVKYDPNEEQPDVPFDKKARTLFWRGATSEGVSAMSGSWKGMGRQRFIHLANNINDTNSPQPILLPTWSRDGKFEYMLAPVLDLAKHVSVDVHVVNDIARCGGKDCTIQTAEFAPLVGPSDFQSHWSYRYLLDLDGAGFSGRFLPFLSSHSLPFKAALFREWYDSRLTPWLHFVPLDLRGHGFWATLVYFAGLEGVVGGRKVSVPAHDREAEAIAEKGRQWAGEVLRKEDMEIYFFRLLLEWGRLTDERRDELGFNVVQE